MTKQECLKKACQILRKRVRYADVVLSLPTTPFPGDDTPAIREAHARLIAAAPDLFQALPGTQLLKLKENENDKLFRMENLFPGYR